MKYAKKVTLPLQGVRFNRTHVVLGEHGKSPSYPKARVIRSYLPKKCVEEVRALLPEPIQKYLISANFAEIRLLAPHVHTKEQCVINYYQTTNGEVTKFYEGDIVKDDSYVVDNGNDFYNVDINLVKEAEQFIANDGEVWVLSSRQPHSVSYGDNREGLNRYTPVNDKYRSVIQLYMDAPFDEVASCF